VDVGCGPEARPTRSRVRANCKAFGGIVLLNSWNRMSEIGNGVTSCVAKELALMAEDERKRGAGAGFKGVLKRWTTDERDGHESPLWWMYNSVRLHKEHLDEESAGRD